MGKTSTAAEATCSRGNYNELRSIRVGGCYGRLVWKADGFVIENLVPGKTRWDRTVRSVVEIMHDLNGATPGVDEHGAAWTTGSEWSKKGTGECVSCDLYGVALWRFPDGREQPLGVVQIRQAARHRPKGRGHLRLRKDYYLIGRNENGVAFAHPVSYAPVRAAARHPAKESDPTAPVRAALAWIWDCRECDLELVQRHGDVALIAGSKCMSQLVEETVTELCAPVRVVDSHVLRARTVAQDTKGRWWVLDAVLHHEKEQHAGVGVRGWSRLQIGRRERTWGFTSPSSD